MSTQIMNNEDSDQSKEIKLVEHTYKRGRVKEVFIDAKNKNAQLNEDANDCEEEINCKRGNSSAEKLSKLVAVLRR